MKESTRLQELIQPGKTLLMPDAYDALSARIIERLGFQAVQCSGFSIALAACRQETDLGLEENLHVTSRIVQAVSVPVMADGEDGFGDAAAIGETVRRYIGIGAAGFNIEDQLLPPPRAKQVVDRQLMIDKISAARETAVRCGDADFFINARTDALAAAQDRTKGLGEAIERANHYLQAGANLAFVTGVASLDEARMLVKGIAGPVSVAAGMPYNMGMSVAQLKECGVARISLPTLAIFAAMGAMTGALSDILAGESFTAIADRRAICSMKDVALLLRS
jgi:2-methylisocitrate lyase-like PEP mutase family enzyme